MMWLSCLELVEKERRLQSEVIEIMALAKFTCCVVYDQAPPRKVIEAKVPETQQVS
jgi:hypothetical protein